MGRVDLGLIREQSHDQRCARHGDQPTEDQGGGRGQAHEARAQGDYGDGDHHLTTAGDQAHFAQISEPRHGQLETDFKEQKNDADLRQHSNPVGIRDEPQPAGPRNGSDHEKTRDGGQPDPLEESEARCGERQ